MRNRAALKKAKEAPSPPCNNHLNIGLVSRI